MARDGGGRRKEGVEERDGQVGERINTRGREGGG